MAPEGVAGGSGHYWRSHRLSRGRIFKGGIMGFGYILHATEDPDGNRNIPGVPSLQLFTNGARALKEAERLAELHREGYISVQVEADHS